jgi:hypothetical protein
MTVNPAFKTLGPDLAAGFTSLVQEVGREVWEPIIPRMLDDLREYPGAPSYPIDWTSERQRLFVLALLRRQAIERGDFTRGPRGGIVITDLRYQRTFDLREGWTAEVVTSGSGVILRVGNSAGAVKFVVGSLNFRSLGEAREPQQRFHADRWQLAAETVRFWFAVAQKEMTDQVNQAFGDLVSFEVKRRSRI